MNPSEVNNETQTRMNNAELGAWLAEKLASPSTSSAQLAQLRRCQPQQIPPTFYWLMAKAELAANRHDLMTRRWQVVCQAIALLTPSGQKRPSAHHPKSSVGRALFEFGEPSRTQAGYSEKRLSTLLNAKGQQFDTLLIRTCRSLANKGQNIDCKELSSLILNTDSQTPQFDQQRQKVARDYYRCAAHVSQ